MPINVAQAHAAEKIAAQIDQINAAIAALLAAIDAGAQLETFAAGVLINGGTATEAITSSFVFSVPDTATAFNALISIYQSNLASLTARLAAIA